MKIAVVGAGIAGLVAAWLLSRRHAVTLFERHAVPGFVASSLALPGGVRVDVPLRVVLPGYYPTLMRLYAELGVATEPVNYATTFTGANGSAYFRWRNLRLGARSWPYVLPQDLRSARARRVVQGALRFRARAAEALARGELGECSIGDFVANQGIEPEFVEGLLLPALATIATCTAADARAYPAAVVAGYAGAGVARDSVRRACAGADGVATRLLAGIGRVQCQAGLTGLHRQGDGVLLAHAGGPERFDHAVFATQANQALTLWHEASAEEAEVLRGFRYRTLEVVMHRDAALMPARRGDWSPVNARVDAAFESPQSTIWINRVQPALRHAAPLFQTVMPQQPPRPELVLGQARFERPLVDGSSARALAGLQRLHAQRGRRVWLCGSYAQAGVPLLESAVRSAYAVAAAVDESSRVPDGLRATSSA